MPSETDSTPPLKRAIAMVDEALEIARREVCSRTQLPTQEQLADLAHLRDVMWMHHSAANAMLHGARLRLGIASDDRAKPFEGDGALRDWQKSLERFGLSVVTDKNEKKSER
jgi:hypothetical protein